MKPQHQIRRIEQYDPNFIFVYFIQPGDESVVKIGQTDCVQSRIGNLQTGNHRELKLLTSARLPRGFETKFHAALTDHWIRGEWFWLRGPVIDLVEAVKTGQMLTIEQALKPKKKVVKFRRC